MTDFNKNATSDPVIKEFGSQEEYQAYRRAIEEKNARIFDEIKQEIPDLGENIAKWYKEGCVKGNIDGVCERYEEEAVLDGTFAAATTNNPEGRRMYFDHLVAGLSEMIVKFDDAKSYKEGLPQEAIDTGVFATPENPTTAVDYTFCGFDKNDKWVEKAAYGTFSLSPNGKFSNHTSTPKNSTPEGRKTTLKNAIEGLIPNTNNPSCEPESYTQD